MSEALELRAGVRYDDAGLRKFHNDLKSIHKAPGMDAVREQFTKLKEAMSVGEAAREGVKVGLRQIGVEALTTTGAVFGLVEAMKGFKERSINVQELSEATGIAFNKLREFQGAAARFNIGSDSSAAGVRAFSQNLFEMQHRTGAAYGQLVGKNREFVESLRSSKTPAEALGKALAAIANTTDPLQKRLLSQTLFGTEDFARIKNLHELREALEASRKNLGSLNPQDVKNAEAFDRAMIDLKNSAQGLADVIGKQLLPVFTPYVNELKEYLRENRGPIETKIAETLVAIKDAAKDVDWARIGADAKSIYDDLKGVVLIIDDAVKSTIGWKNLIEIGIILRVGALAVRVTGLATAFGLLGTATNVLAGGALARVLAMLGMRAAAPVAVEAATTATTATAVTAATATTAASVGGALSIIGALRLVTGAGMAAAIGIGIGKAFEAIGSVANGKFWLPKTQGAVDDLKGQLAEKEKQIADIQSRIHPSMRGEFNPQVDALEKEAAELRNRIAAGEKQVEQLKKLDDSTKDLKRTLDETNTSLKALIQKSSFSPDEDGANPLGSAMRGAAAGAAGARRSLRYGGHGAGDGDGDHFGPVGKFNRTKSFDEKAPDVMSRLMKDFNLTSTQAAGALGSLGHESAGFTAFQEKNPRAGRGGAGWAQWTGPRRRQFEAWAAEQGLDPRSDEANYGFLRHELSTTYRGAIDHLRQQNNLKDAVIGFERDYEQAGVKAYGSRYRYGAHAKELYDRSILKGARDAGAYGSPPKQEPIKGDFGVRVDVNAPQGTRVTARGDDMFKRITLNRGSSMPLASETG